MLDCPKQRKIWKFLSWAVAVSAVRTASRERKAFFMEGRFSVLTKIGQFSNTGVQNATESINKSTKRDDTFKNRSGWFFFDSPG
jgi:hypothetical protein